jgi:hypothetical protein
MSGDFKWRHFVGEILSCGRYGGIANTASAGSTPLPGVCALPKTAYRRIGGDVGVRK